MAVFCPLGQFLIGALADAFPGTVRDGGLDRRALGKIVFASKKKLEMLNEITHSAVRREVDRRLRNFAMKGGTLAAIDAVELISAGIAGRCTAVIGVISDRERRLARITARDGISREAAAARIDAQRPDSYYEANCTHILLNHADEASFREDCRRLYKEILNHG